MIFEPLSSKFALNLIDANLDSNKLINIHKNDGEVIKRTLFTESFYLSRFIDMLSENIRKSHTTLPYILRTQYRNSNTVFDILANCTDTNTAIYAINKEQKIAEYFQDVHNYIIMPVLKRHGVYSFNIVYLLFINLVFHMAADYISKDYKKLVFSLQDEIYKNNYDIVWINDAFKTFMNEELQVWKTLKQQHSKKYNY